MIDTRTVSSDKLLLGRSEAVCEINIAQEGEAGDKVIGKIIDIIHGTFRV